MIKMKKSNIILASLLVFIAVATIVLNIDFKMNEVAYKDKMEIKVFKLNKYRKDFHVSLEQLKDSMTIKNWDSFIFKSTLYLSSGDAHSMDEFMGSNAVYLNFKIYSDSTALYQAKVWAKKAAISSPNSCLYNDNYARILFELGFVNGAVKYAEIAMENAIKQGGNKTGIYSERLTHFKSFTRGQ
ncbi:MAG: hypothetical protein COB98_11320 [Flavobacteriaceae bacterium]|nr:MAG: hypothetical protein COB98_11320 [Flavobacteriaceae bacterium]